MSDDNKLERRAPEDRPTLSLEQLKVIAERWESEGHASKRELMLFYWCFEKAVAHDELAKLYEEERRERTELRALIEAKDASTKARLYDLEVKDTQRDRQIIAMNARIDTLAASFDAMFDEVSRVGDKATTTSQDLRALAARLQNDT